MKVTLLDTKTGIRREVDDNTLDWFQWTQNNWSCDCNRRNYFDLSDEEEDQMDADAHGFCLGEKRFLVVKVPAGEDISEFNSGYPKELIVQFVLPHGRASF